MPWDFIAFSLFSYHCIFTIFFDSWYFTYFLWFSLSICSLEVTVHWNSPLWGASLAFWLPFTYLLFTLEVLAAYYLPYGLYFCIALVSCFLQGSLDYLNVLLWLLLTWALVEVAYYLLITWDLVEVSHLLTYLPYGLIFDVMDLMYDVLLIMPHFCVCSIPMSHGRVVLCSLRVSPTLDLVLHSPCIFSLPVCVDLVLGAPWVHFSTFACLWLILDVTADMMDVSRCWSILVCGSLFWGRGCYDAFTTLPLAGGRYMWWCGSRDHGVYAGNPCAVAFRMFFFAFTWDLVDVSPPVTSLWLLPLLVCWHPAEVVVLVSVILHAIGTRCILHCHPLPGTCVPFTYLFCFGVVPHAFDSCVASVWGSLIRCDDCAYHKEHGPPSVSQKRSRMLNLRDGVYPGERYEYCPEGC